MYLDENCKFFTKSLLSPSLIFNYSYFKLTFDEHVKRIHNPKNLILKKRIHPKRLLVQKCSICPWLGSALNQHWKDEHPKETLPFLCHLCNQRSCSEIYLQNHIKNNHSGVFYCHMCDFKCENRWTFKEHVTRVHNPKNVVLKEKVPKKRLRHKRCSLCPWKGTALAKV